MYTLDTALLQECGVRDLDDAAQQELLARLCADLEYRVGISLSEGMNEGTIDEFARLADAHELSVTRWLERHRPDFEDDSLYLSIAEALPEADASAVRAEYASTIWLALHRPDYRDVVAAVFAALKRELTADPVGTIRRLQREHSSAVVGR
jgi:hypothetical protein